MCELLTAEAGFKTSPKKAPANCHCSRWWSIAGTFPVWIRWAAADQPNANRGSVRLCGAARLQQGTRRGPRLCGTHREVPWLHSPATRALAAMIRLLSASVSARESGGNERINEANGPSLLICCRAETRERAAARDSTERRGNLSNPAAEAVAGSKCDCGPISRIFFMLDCAPLLRFPLQTQTTLAGFHPWRSLLTPHSSYARTSHSG
jgi:hypothetical protein